MQNIAEAIKQSRTEKGISAAELAEKIGVSRCAIHAFERGAKSPSVNTFIAIADALGTTASQLLTEKNNKQ